MLSGLLLFIPANFPQLVYKRPYVLSCLWNVAQNRCLAADQKVAYELAAVGFILLPEWSLIIHPNIK